MAKLKFAFQAEYYKTHRRKFRDYVFGYFPVAAGLAASMAPLSNALLEIPVIKTVVAKTLGITSRRPFPKFSKTRAVPATETMSQGENKKQVIFLSDPFARYIEPETEQAAFDILTRCGLDVQTLPILGAGASFLSKGFIDQARHHAARVLDLLQQVDPAGELSIVGIEPPEIFTLKHDYVDLLPERWDEVNLHLRNVWLLDEYLLRSTEFQDLRIAKKEHLSNGGSGFPDKKVMFHPHCHQRAEGPSPDGFPNGVNATVQLLRSCGYEVELMDTGCCGMAGTFGYEEEHYELSMKVGELKLFPKLREWKIEGGEIISQKSETLAPHAQVPWYPAQRGTVPGSAGVENPKSRVASSGAACRLQIRQGTAVEAVHPIVLVANAVNKAENDDQRS